MSSRSFPDDAYGEDFGPRVDLTARIREILLNYPEGTSVLKELLQNADDAQATHFVICLDERQHSTDTVLGPRMVPYQGPSLLAYNNAIFTAEDFKSVQNIGDSQKKQSLSKTGRFGIGLQSVYHLSDILSFVSGNSVVFFDPHVRFLPHVSSSDPGKRFEKSKFASRFPDAWSPFNIPELGCEGDADKEFGGTLFRFALRTSEQSESSRLSKANYTCEKVRGMLQDFAREAANCLLFLKNIQSIEIAYIPSSTGVMTTLHKSHILAPSPDVLSKRRFLLQLEQQRKAGTAFSYRELQMLRFQLNIESIDYNDADAEPAASINTWMLCQALGPFSFDPSVPKSELALKSIPWAGCAALVSSSSAPSSPADAAAAASQQLKGSAYCFLPLPVHTNLPIHINGFFEISSNRRDIWTGEDLRGVGQERFEWNVKLLKELVGPCYATLLADAAQLQDSLFSIEKYESLWPKENTVTGIWTTIFDTFYRSLLRLPVLPAPVSHSSTMRFVSPLEGVLPCPVSSTSLLLLDTLRSIGVKIVQTAEHITSPLLKRFSDFVSVLTAPYTRLILRELMFSSDSAKIHSILLSNMDGASSLFSFCISDLSPSSSRSAVNLSDFERFKTEFNAFKASDVQNDSVRQIFEELLGLPIVPLLDNTIVPILEPSIKKAPLLLLSTPESKVLAAAGSTAVLSFIVASSVSQSITPFAAFALSQFSNVRRLNASSDIPNLLLPSILPPPLIVSGAGAEKLSSVHLASSPSIALEWISDFWALFLSYNTKIASEILSSLHKFRLLPTTANDGLHVYPCDPLLPFVLLSEFQGEGNRPLLDAFASLGLISIDQLTVFGSSLSSSLPSAAHPIWQLVSPSHPLRILEAIGKSLSLTSSSQQKVSSATASSALLSFFSQIHRQRIDNKDLVMTDAHRRILSQIPIIPLYGESGDVRWTSMAAEKTFLKILNTSSSHHQWIPSFIFTSEYVSVDSIAIDGPQEGLSRSSISQFLQWMGCVLVDESQAIQDCYLSRSDVFSVPQHMEMLSCLSKEFPRLRSSSTTLFQSLKQSPIIPTNANTLQSAPNLYHPQLLSSEPELHTFLDVQNSLPSSEISSNEDILSMLLALGMRMDMNQDSILTAARDLSASFSALTESDLSKKKEDDLVHRSMALLSYLDRIADTKFVPKLPSLPSVPAALPPQLAAQHQSSSGFFSSIFGKGKAQEQLEQLQREVEAQRAELMRVYSEELSASKSFFAELSSIPWLPALSSPPDALPLPWLALPSSSSSAHLSHVFCPPIRCRPYSDMWMTSSCRFILPETAPQIRSSSLLSCFTWTTAPSPVIISYQLRMLGRSVAQAVASAKTQGWDSFCQQLSIVVPTIYRRLNERQASSSSSASSTAEMKRILTLLSPPSSPLDDATQLDIIAHVFESQQQFLSPAELQSIKSILFSESPLTIWTGERFVVSSICAFSSPINAAPYLWTVPRDLASFRKLLQTLGVRDEFDANDFISALEEMHTEAAASSLPSEKLELALLLSDRLAALLSVTKAKKYDGDLTIFIPDKTGKLMDSTILCFDDAPWLSSPSSSSALAPPSSSASSSSSSSAASLITAMSSIRFVHPRLAHQVASTLGCSSLRTTLVSKQSSVLQIGTAKVEAFGQKESLTARLKNILALYPEQSLLLELLQNADDARATEVAFMLDSNHYASNSLLSPQMERYQGPSLLAFNDALFSEKDFQSLCTIGQDHKLEKPGSTGRFGLGFCSVYHVTDLPTIVSGTQLVLLDPHQRSLPGATASNPGLRIRFAQSDLSFSFPDQMAPFLQWPGCNMIDAFNGTLFRFPLRSAESSADSEIKQGASVSEADILRLFIKFREAASSSLLFLRHVKRVSFLIAHPSASASASAPPPKLLFSVSLNEAGGKGSVSERQRIPEFISGTVERPKTKAQFMQRMAEARRAMAEDLVPEAELGLPSSIFTLDVKVDDYCPAEDMSFADSSSASLYPKIESKPVESLSERWLISSILGGPSAIKLAAAEEFKHLRLIPWGAVAARLSSSSSSSSSSSVAAASALSPAATPLEIVEEFQGRAFCFLPLPILTNMPVHIHGSFELSSNRRDLWLGHGDQGGEGEGRLRYLWNVALCKETISTAYSNLVMAARTIFRTDANDSELISYLNLFPCDASNSAFRLTVEQFYKTVNSLPVLPLAGRSQRTWVSPQESLLMVQAFPSPPSSSSSASSPSSSAIELHVKQSLLAIGANLVDDSIPLPVRESLLSRCKGIRLVSPAVTRSLLIDFYKKQPKFSSPLKLPSEAHLDIAISLLRYCLSDVSSSSLSSAQSMLFAIASSISQVPLIPLCDGSLSYFGTFNDTQPLSIASVLEVALFYDAAASQMIHPSAAVFIEPLLPYLKGTNISRFNSVSAASALTAAMPPGGQLEVPWTVSAASSPFSSIEETSQDIAISALEYMTDHSKSHLQSSLMPLRVPLLSKSWFALFWYSIRNAKEAAEQLVSSSHFQDDLSSFSGLHLIPCTLNRVLCTLSPSSSHALDFSPLSSDQDLISSLTSLGIRSIDLNLINGNSQSLPQVLRPYVRTANSGTNVLDALSSIQSFSVNRHELEIGTELTGDQRRALISFLTSRFRSGEQMQWTDEHRSLIKRLPIFESFSSSSSASSSSTFTSLLHRVCIPPQGFDSSLFVSSSSETVFLRIPDDPTESDRLLSLLQWAGVSSMTRSRFIRENALPALSSLPGDLRQSTTLQCVRLQPLLQHEDPGLKKVLSESLLVPDRAGNWKLVRHLFSPRISSSARDLMDDSSFPDVLFCEDEIHSLLLSLGLQTEMNLEGVVTCAKRIAQKAAEVQVENGEAIDSAVRESAVRLLSYLDGNPDILRRVSLGESIEQYLHDLQETEWIPIKSASSFASSLSSSLSELPLRPIPSNHRLLTTPSQCRPQQDLFLASSHWFIVDHPLSSPELRKALGMHSPLSAKHVAKQLVSLGSHCNSDLVSESKQQMLFIAARSCFQHLNQVFESDELRGQESAEFVEAVDTMLKQSPCIPCVILVPAEPVEAAVEVERIEVNLEEEEAQPPSSPSSPAAAASSSSSSHSRLKFFIPSRVSLLQPGSEGYIDTEGFHLASLHSELVGSPFTPLLHRLGVKQSFSSQDYASLLRELSSSSSSSISNTKKTSLSLSVLKQIASNNEPVPDSLHVLDESNHLVPSSSIAYNDANWLEDPVDTASGLGFSLVHPSISQAEAEALGCISLRSLLMTQNASKTSKLPCPSIPHLMRRFNGSQSQPNVVMDLIETADLVNCNRLHLVIDERTHPGRSLLHPALESLQGPALVAFFEGTVLTAEDLVQLQSLDPQAQAQMQSKRTIQSNSVLSKNPSWRYLRSGFGLLSSYTLSPVLQIISGSHLSLFDPSGQYLTHAGGSSSTPKAIIYPFLESDTIKKHPDQFAPFLGLFGFRSSQALRGTLIRISLTGKPLPLGQASELNRLSLVNEMMASARPHLSPFLLFSLSLSSITFCRFIAPPPQAVATATALPAQNPGSLELICNVSIADDRGKRLELAVNAAWRKTSVLSFFGVSSSHIQEVSEFVVSIMDNSGDSPSSAARGREERWALSSVLAYGKTRALALESTSNVLLPYAAAAARFAVDGVFSSPNEDGEHGEGLLCAPVPLLLRSTNSSTYQMAYFEVDRDTKDVRCTSPAVAVAASSSSASPLIQSISLVAAQPLSSSGVGDASTALQSLETRKAIWNTELTESMALAHVELISHLTARALAQRPHRLKCLWPRKSASSAAVSASAAQFYRLLGDRPLVPAIDGHLHKLSDAFVLTTPVRRSILNLIRCAFLLLDLFPASSLEATELCEKPPKVVTPERLRVAVRKAIPSSTALSMAGSRINVGPSASGGVISSSDLAAILHASCSTTESVLEILEYCASDTLINGSQLNLARCYDLLGLKLLPIALPIANPSDLEDDLLFENEEASPSSHLAQAPLVVEFSSISVSGRFYVVATKLEQALFPSLRRVGQDFFVDARCIERVPHLFENIEFLTAARLCPMNLPSLAFGLNSKFPRDTLVTRRRIPNWQLEGSALGITEPWLRAFLKTLLSKCKDFAEVVASPVAPWPLLPTSDGSLLPISKLASLILIAPSAPASVDAEQADVDVSVHRIPRLPSTQLEALLASLERLGCPSLDLAFIDLFEQFAPASELQPINNNGPSSSSSLALLLLKRLRASFSSSSFQSSSDDSILSMPSRQRETLLELFSRAHDESLFPPAESVSVLQQLPLFLNTQGTPVRIAHPINTTYFVPSSSSSASFEPLLALLPSPPSNLLQIRTEEQKKLALFAGAQELTLAHAYRHLVLPHFSALADASKQYTIIEGIRSSFTQLCEEDPAFEAMLKDFAFVPSVSSPNTLMKASDAFNPKLPLLAQVFSPSSHPNFIQDGPFKTPEPMLQFLQRLGMKNRIDSPLFLSCAKHLEERVLSDYEAVHGKRFVTSAESSSPPPLLSTRSPDLVQACRALWRHFIDKFGDIFNPPLGKQLAHVLCLPVTAADDYYHSLEESSPQQVSSSLVITCFSACVLPQFHYLVFRTRPQIPQDLLPPPVSFPSLSISNAPSMDAIVMNLCSVRQVDIDRWNYPEPLAALYHRIFTYVSERWSNEAVVTPQLRQKLKHAAIVPCSSSNSSSEGEDEDAGLLVRPDRLVFRLPSFPSSSSANPLAPFVFEVPRRFLAHERILRDLGALETLDSSFCVRILAQIYAEKQGKRLSPSEMNAVVCLLNLLADSPSSKLLTASSSRDPLVVPTSQGFLADASQVFLSDENNELLSSLLERAAATADEPLAQLQSLQYVHARVSSAAALALGVRRLSDTLSIILAPAPSSSSAIAPSDEGLDDSLQKQLSKMQESVTSSSSFMRLLLSIVRDSSIHNNRSIMDEAMLRATLSSIRMVLTPHLSVSLLLKSFASSRKQQTLCTLPVPFFVDSSLQAEGITTVHISSDFEQKMQRHLPFFVTLAILRDVIKIPQKSCLAAAGLTALLRNMQVDEEDDFSDVLLDCLGTVHSEKQLEQLARGKPGTVLLPFDITAIQSRPLRRFFAGEIVAYKSGDQYFYGQVVSRVVSSAASPSLPLPSSSSSSSADSSSSSSSSSSLSVLKKKFSAFASKQQQESVSSSSSSQLVPRVQVRISDSDELKEFLSTQIFAFCSELFDVCLSPSSLSSAPSTRPSPVLVLPLPSANAVPSSASASSAAAPQAEEKVFYQVVSDLMKAAGMDMSHIMDSEKQKLLAETLALKRELEAIKKQKQQAAAQVKTLEQEMEAMAEEKLCPICKANDCDTTMVPCGHMYCGSCSNRIHQSCPTCREEVNMKMKIYFS